MFLLVYHSLSTMPSVLIFLFPRSTCLIFAGPHKDRLHGHRGAMTSLLGCGPRPVLVAGWVYPLDVLESATIFAFRSGTPLVPCFRAFRAFVFSCCKLFLHWGPTKLCLGVRSLQRGKKDSGFNMFKLPTPQGLGVNLFKVTPLRTVNTTWGCKPPGLE